MLLLYRVTALQEYLGHLRTLKKDSSCPIESGLSTRSYVPYISVIDLSIVKMRSRCQEQGSKEWSKFGNIPDFSFSATIYNLKAVTKYRFVVVTQGKNKLKFSNEVFAITPSESLINFSVMDLLVMKRSLQILPLVENFRKRGETTEEVFLI